MPRRYFPLSFATALFVFSTLAVFGIPIVLNGPAKYISPIQEFFGTGSSPAIAQRPASSTHEPDDNAIQADQFFAGDGTGLATAKWGTSPSGPFTSLFTSGNVANFAVVNGTGTGGSITVGGINASENFTITSTSGTISNASNGVIPINVAAGKTLDLSTQSFTSSATAGYIFTGPGTLALAGNTYGGGFTINSGTLIARGVNAMGGTAANTLTITGGTIAANASRDFTGKYGGGITLGGNVQIGALAANVPLALDAASLTFSNNVSLGAAQRTITIGGNGSYTLGGIISGAAGSGLTIARLNGSTGAINLSGINSYTGPTAITNGALALLGTASIANSSMIEIGEGGIFDVTALTTALILANGQELRASGTTATGMINTSSTKGVTTASNSPIRFTAYNGTTAPLTVALSGKLALQPGNPVTVTVSNGGSPLGIGDHKLIAKSGTASVTGTPNSVTVDGDGITAGTSASLVNISNELYLRITASAAPIIQISDLNFGNVTVGTTSSLNITVQNTGTADLVLGSASLTGTNAADYSVPNSPSGTTIAPGNSTQVQVDFTPSAIGSRTATLTLTSNAASGDNAASLVGTGVAPDISVSPTSVNFGSQVVSSTSTQQTITVQNVGSPGQSLAISNIGISGTNAADFAIVGGPTLPALIAQGNQIQFGVTFTPSATGSRSAQITISSNDPDESSVNVDLQGTGSQPGSFQLSSATYSGGESSGMATITVNRSGGSDGAVSIDYSTSNGTATGGADCSGGADYTTTSGTLSWADGESSSKTFDIPICDDAVVEGDETVNISISNPTGGSSLGTPDTAVLTITSDDLDQEEPTTDITSNPTDPSAATADFSFTGNDTGGSGLAGFECQIDSGGFTSCTSPKQYNGLASGPHTFEVRANDNAGNVDSTPAGFTWTVDADPPDTMITATPPTPMASQYANFEFTGSDTAGGSGLAGFECSLNGASFASCTSPATVTAVFNIANTFRVRSRDAVGNVDPTPAEFTWTPVPGSAVEFAPTIVAPEGLIKTVTMQRTGDTSGSASVDWTTVADSTAVGAATCTPGVDFQTASGTVSFAPGESSKSLDVSICGDNQIESAEYFTISLSNAVGVGYGYPYSGVITIRDTANEYTSISSTDIFGGATSELPSITISSGSIVGGLRVSLFNVTHPNPDDLDFLLVGPQGQTFVMMADVGGSSGLTDATITLEDAASVQLPDTTVIDPLTNYRPAVCTVSGTVSDFLGAAPPGPYNQAGCSTTVSTFSSVFGNHDPNGSWRLFVRDDSGDPGAAIPVGSLGGWGMQILSPTAARASLSGRVQTPQGFGIRDALVTINGGGLNQPKSFVTGSFGAYRFDDLPVGAVYVVSVRARRYSFPQAIVGVSLQDNVVDFNFVSEP